MHYLNSTVDLLVVYHEQRSAWQLGGVSHALFTQRDTHYMLDGAYATFIIRHLREIWTTLYK